MVARVQVRPVSNNEGNKLLQIVRRSSGSVARLSALTSQRVSEPGMSSYVSRRLGRSVRVGGGGGGLTAAKSRSGTESLSRSWLRP